MAKAGATKLVMRFGWMGNGLRWGDHQPESQRARGFRPAWSALKVSLPVEEKRTLRSMVLKGVNGCVKSLPGPGGTAPYPVQPSNPLPQYFTLQEAANL